MSVKILNFKIKEVNAFKIIIDTLTKIVSETIWTITNTENNFCGLEITTADPSRSIFIKIQIEKSNFTNFKSKYKKHEIGINLEKLNKMLKCVETNDILNIYIIEENLQYLMIDIKRASTKGKKILKLPLIDLENEKKPLKKEEYEIIISTTSMIYKKIFKEYDNFENIKIICNKTNVLFIYKDTTGAEINDEYILNEDGIDINEYILNEVQIDNLNTNNKFIGVYQIKNLILFAKCANLCEKIEIYMKNKDRLIVKLQTINFGTIVISLPPINEDCIKNTDYNYSDDEEEIIIINNKHNKLCH